MIEEAPTLTDEKSRKDLKAMKLQIAKNVPKWAADTPNLLEHERRQLAQQIGEALYDEGYIEIEEREGYESGFNCEKSIIIKMTFDFIARDNDAIVGGVDT